MTNFLFGWLTKGHCDVSMMDTFVCIFWLVATGCAGVIFFAWLGKKND